MNKYIKAAGGTDSYRERQIRHSGFVQVLSKTNRILGASTTDVEAVATHVSAPAYTDGVKITLNTSWSPLNESLSSGFTLRSMAVVTALNYHELAHCLFTPRTTSTLVKKVVEKGMFDAMNVLEDQLAETRFVKLYEPSRHYFSSLVNEYMRSSMETNYVLVSGRLFLPKKVRNLFLDQFKYPEMIPEIDDIVSTYKSLTYPDDEESMYAQIKRLNVILASMRSSGSPVPSTAFGSHDQSLGQPDKGLVKELDKTEEFVNDEDQEEESGKQYDAGSKQEEQDGEVGDERKETSEADEDREEGDESEGAKGGEKQAGSTGSGSGESSAEPENDALDEMIDQIIEEIGNELSDKIESVRRESIDNYKVNRDLDTSWRSPVETDMRRSLEGCLEELRAIENRYAPGWHKQQRSGKLDARRYVKALQGSDDVFRRWKDGAHNSMDFEVVFLLDRSGSMAGNSITEACKAMWVLRRMFEEYGGTCTALGFAGGGDTQLIIQRNDKASNSTYERWNGRGGTVVSDALDEALTIAYASAKTLKLFVVLTDGSFHDGGQAKEVVAHFPAGSVLLVGLQSDVRHVWEGIDSVLHRQTIRQPMELVDLVKQFASAMSEHQARREVI